MPYDLTADMPRLHKVVDSAPSIFNQRPWELVQAAKDRLDLYSVPVADLGGRLPREVAISCGAALYNVRLALRVAGRTPAVSLLPDLDRDPGLLTTITAAPTRLASVEIMLGRATQPPDAAQELYEALWLRRTDRGPFRYLPVPPPILVEMEVAAAHERGWLRALPNAESRRLRRAAARASGQLGSTFGSLLNVDPAAYGPIPADTDEPPTRPELWRADEVARFERHPQFMALSTDDDRPLDWLRAGEALQHALLTGTRYSMSALGGRSTGYRSQLQYGPLDPHRLRRRPPVPEGYVVEASYLTQSLEAADLLQQRRSWPWRSNYTEVPQVFIRVGYAPAARTPAPGMPTVPPAIPLPRRAAS